MAFTAIHPDAGRIDASRIDLGCGLDWMQIYRVRPRIQLGCPECGFGVHAKVSPRGLRYFAHDPGRPPECQMSNESIEHHLLKLELATAIRAANWHAELEVRAENGLWRADVMAISTDGERRMAWEAQLSPITNFDLLSRTARYADSDIDVCWVSPRDAVPWLGVVPAIGVAEPADGLGWTVADGLARFDNRNGAWFVVKDTALETFVRWVLAGKVNTHFILDRYRRIHLGGKRQARRNEIWTTDKSVQLERAHNVMRERQTAWKAKKDREEQEAERRRLAVEEVERAEAERLRKIQEEIHQAEAAEAHRLWKIEWDTKQQVLEAERLAKEEQERQAEAQRQERDRLEREAADGWWAEVSDAQWQELVAGIDNHCLKHLGGRAAVHRTPTEPKYAFGIPVYVGGWLRGIARPNPGSLYRLGEGLLAFVRSKREAEMLAAHGNITPERIVCFNLPDHEQVQLF
ncbi:competence protein CoiA family protein [Catenulispora subtropica]|uniref:Competence protein CoiA nuclease-like domain-containing protein n=1 Tax=Catenulispora subtropica TaxID=450798 RepID=A0ABN2TH16_9ACTN